MFDSQKEKTMFDSRLFKTSQQFSEKTTDTFYAVYHKDGYLVDNNSQLLSVNNENAIYVGYDKQKQAEHLVRVLDRRGDYDASNLWVVEITINSQIDFKVV